MAKLSQSSRAVKAMIEHAKPLLLVNINDFDKDQWLLNVENGTIDLRTGKLLTHNLENLITNERRSSGDEGTATPDKIRDT